MTGLFESEMHLRNPHAAQSLWADGFRPTTASDIIVSDIIASDSTNGVTTLLAAVHDVYAVGNLTALATSAGRFLLESDSEVWRRIRPTEHVEEPF